MKKIHLVVIEDNRLLREGIVAMFKQHADIKVVDASGDKQRTPVKIRESKPDVVLLDLGLRTQNSLEMVRTIKKDFPETKMIVMDLLPTEEDIFEFVRAGVSGFILKDARIDDFLKTVRTVAAGAKVLPTRLTGSLFSQIVRHAVNGGTGSPSKLIQSVRMTRREREVIKLIADGHTNREIAQKLCLSTYTIKSHVHNILEKLALHTRVQIASHARTNQNFTPPENGGSSTDR